MFRPTLATLGQMLVQLAQTWPKLGHMCSSPGNVWTTFGPIIPDFRAVTRTLVPQLSGILLPSAVVGKFMDADITNIAAE